MDTDDLPRDASGQHYLESGQRVPAVAVTCEWRDDSWSIAGFGYTLRPG